ncbi:RNA polymerase sigma factor [Niallia taxi]|uniref:RNA polymerase sigma factor n=1 Tax=Niallia taxi TaxID=2499688 RepID=UPI00203FEC8C|nr:sigma-70 family RNA polymerase sigma factor [Niallia taxi]MCM3217392.1 sigma-70 family RNA polymerase sigma factor [Niallia taxi]
MMEPLINNYTGDSKEACYEEIIKEHGNAIFAYILSLVKHKELAEDIYQEVLISSYLSFSSFEDYSKAKSWLYKIAINKCRDYWRKEKTSKKFWEETVYTYVRETSVSLPPEDTIINKCAQEEMIDTLEELPQMYKEPLLLFYYHNNTLLEISDKTKTPLSTVKTRMKRAKEQLRPKVNKLVSI